MATFGEMGYKVVLDVNLANDLADEREWFVAEVVAGVLVDARGNPICSASEPCANPFGGVLKSTYQDVFDRGVEIQYTFAYDAEGQLVYELTIDTDVLGDQEIQDMYCLAHNKPSSPIIDMGELPWNDEDDLEYDDDDWEVFEP